MMGPDDDYGLSALNLSDDQQRQITQIRQQLGSEHAVRMGEWLEARDALQTQLNAPAPNPDAVVKAYDRVAALERELLRARVQGYNRMQAVLTEAQRRRWQSVTGGTPW